MAKKYDLVVIGSGPGGQRAAIQAAKLRKRVLLVEKDKLGGSSVHTGTLPSKTLREAALRCTPGQSLNQSLALIMKHKDFVIRSEMDLIHSHCKSNAVTIANGIASFSSPHKLQIKGHKSSLAVEAEKIIIATGTRPTRPTNFLFDAEYIFDSDQILKLKSLPKSLLIIGAGVIGCEYASIFARLGVKVTLVDRREQLLRSVDTEVVECLKLEFKASGVELLLGVELGEPKVLKGGARGSPKLEISIKRKKRKFHAALICMGRDGNVGALNLPNTGIEADTRGILKVNDHYQTNVSHIYAVGDIIGFPALAASASEQGRLAACHAFGVSADTFPSTFPYGIYTIPETSSVGAMEQELKEKKIEYIVGRAEYNELARGLIQKEERGLLKMLFARDSKKLLGIHIIGAQASELVHIGQVVMSYGGTVEFFLLNVFNYPTLAEAYKVAAFNAWNKFLSGAPSGS